MSKRKKIIRGGIGLAVVLVIVLITVTAVMRLDTIATATMQRMIPVAEQALGRQVKAGSLSIKFLGGFRVMVEDVAIMKQALPPAPEGDHQAPAKEGEPAGEPEAEPEFAVKTLEIRIKMIPLITSLGRQVSIDIIRVHGLYADLTLDSEGRLSYQDILDTLAAAGPDEAPTEEPGEEEQKEAEGEEARELMTRLMGGLAMDLIAIEEANFTLRDHSDPDNPDRYSINPLNLRIATISNGKPATVTLEAAVEAPGSDQPAGEDKDSRHTGRGRLTLSLETAPLNLNALLPPPRESDQPQEKPLIAGLKSLTVDVESLDLGMAARFLPGDLPVTMEGAVLTTRMEVANLVLPESGDDSGDSPDQLPDHSPPTPTTPPSPGEPTTLKGSLAVNNVGVLDGGDRFNTNLAFHLAVDPALEWVHIEDLNLDLGGQILTAKGKVSGLPNLPRFDDLEIAAPALNLGRLLALAPALNRALPPGARVGGVAAISVTGKGDTSKQQVRGDINLNRTTLHLPGLLHKPAGTPLRLTLGAGLAGLTQGGSQTIDLNRLDLHLGSLHLQAGGRITMPPAGGVSTPSIQLELKEATAPFDGLARLFPLVADSVPPDVTIDGQIHLGGRVSLKQEDLDSNLTFRATRLALSTPQAVLDGSMELLVKASGNLSRVLGATVDLDMSGLTIEVPGVVSKKKNTPASLRISGNLEQKEDLLNLTTASLRFSPLEVNLSGRVKGVTGQAGGAGPTADLGFQVAPFTVAGLMGAMPTLKEMLPIPERPGRLENLRGTIKGDLSHPEGLAITIDPLELRYGVSHLNLVASTSLMDGAGPAPGARTAKKGQARKQKAQAKPPVRQVALKVRSRNLDGGDFLVDQGDDKKEKEDGGPLDLAILQAFAGGVDVKVDKGKFQDYQFQNLTADLTLAKGRATARQMGVQTMGGKVDLSGTYLDSAQAVPAIGVKASLESIKIEELLHTLFGFDSFLKGNINGKLEADGKGLDGEALLASLTGSLAGGIKEGHLSGMSLVEEILDPLNKSLPAGLRNRDLAGALQKLVTGGGGAGGKAKSAKGAKTPSRGSTAAARILGGTSFQDMQAGFKFHKGTLQLVDKIAARTDLGALELTGGGLSLAEGLMVDARVLLSTQTVSSLTGGHFTPAAPLPINFKIEGPLHKPKITGLSLQDTARTIAKGMGEKALGAGAAEVLGKSPAQLKAEASAAARAAADEAKQKAARARQQAEAEAKKKAAAAAKKVADEKKRLEQEARRKAAAEKKRLEEAARKKAEKQKKKAQQKLRDRASSIFK